MSKPQTFLTIEPDGLINVGEEVEGTKLQVDHESRRLYVDDKPVITERRITFPWFVNLAAIFASIATVGMFLVMLLERLRIYPL